MDIMLSEINRYTNKSLLTCAITLAVQTLGYHTCLYNPFINNSYLKRHTLEDADNMFYDRYKTNIEFAHTYKGRSCFREGTNDKEAKDKVSLSKIYFEYKELLAKYDAIVSEDNDSLMSPLTDELLNYELVKMLNIPIALVSSPCDDWCERILYSINCLQNMGITLRGIILSKFPRNPNKIIANLPKYIETYTNCPILGIIKEFKDNSYIPTKELAYMILKNIDMSKLLGRKIYYPNYVNL